MSAPFYTAAEVARFCGLSLDHFYAARERLHAIDKLPRPFKQSGHLRFDRARVDAWRRSETLPVTANDALPAATLAEHRAELAREYGGRR